MIWERCPLLQKHDFYKWVGHLIAVYAVDSYYLYTVIAEFCRKSHPQKSPDARSLSYAVVEIPTT
jgi:hypothetical protein